MIFVAQHTPRRAFTLIELLVVIAIIGILSAVVLASLNTARAKSRDTSRIAQLREVQKALEMYYADFGSYPSTSSGWRGTETLSDCFGSHGNNAIPGLVPTYISSLPKESQYIGTGNGCFSYRSNGTEYKFISHLVMETCTAGSCPLQDPSRLDQKSSAVYSPGGSAL